MATQGLKFSSTPLIFNTGLSELFIPIKLINPIKHKWQGKSQSGHLRYFYQYVGISFPQNSQGGALDQNLDEDC